VNDNSYWTRLTKARLSRRRAIGGAAAIGAGAAAMGIVGCGGGGGGGGSGGGGSSSSGIVATPKDTTAQAKPGGVFKDVVTADTTTLDPIASTSFTAKAYVAAFTYPQLVKFKTAKYPASADGTVEGDGAESFEISGDKLQITFKVRPGMKWDPRSPTNGREIDAEDVVRSLTRFQQINPFAGDLFYDAQKAPLSPIESVSSPDSKTVIFKLKLPDASLLPNMAHYAAHYILPRESEVSGPGGFDPKSDVRGYGPWLLEDYKPSASFIWKKNPDYYVKGRPFPDKIERPIVTEYATRLAQFKAGGIWTSVVTADDVFPTKRDLPATEVRQAENYASGATSIGFGYGNGDTVWKDQRLRQAINYLLDRETLVDVLGNRQEYKKEGVDLAYRFHSIVGAGWEGYWVDPTDEKKFGPNAKFFSQNVPEAKKLVAAAGFPNGLETTMNYNGSTNYGAAYTRLAETLIGMMNETGVIKVKQGPREYQNDWLPNYHFAYTKSYQSPTRTFDGMALRAPTFYATLAQSLFTNQHSAGSRFEGCSPDGKNAQDGDPQLNGMIEKLKAEFDLNKAHALALDIAQFVADKAYFIQGGAFSSLGYGVWWPVIGNLGVWRTWTTSRVVPETSLHWWIDDSKPPLARS
jgi:ABC-type transport system substrate-binding protein